MGGLSLYGHKVAEYCKTVPRTPTVLTVGVVSKI